MKCTNCGQENRAALKFCKKCGLDMTLPPAWFPDWRWHLKTLSWIYLVLIAGFFTVSYVLHKLPYGGKDSERIGPLDPLLVGRAHVVYERGEHAQGALL